MKSGMPPKVLSRASDAGYGIGAVVASITNR